MAVQAAREKSGLRQAQAAALCGVGTRFMSDLENGKPTLQTAKVLKVLRALGMQIILQPRKFGHGGPSGGPPGPHRSEPS